MKTNRNLFVSTVIAALCPFLANLVHAQSPTLVNALDAPQLTWTTGGNQPWIGQTTVTHDGVDAARSGVTGNDQESWLQTTVTGPGTLIFWWKVSSEFDFDYLEFHLNGDLQSGSISGDVDWQQRTFDLSDGSQTLRWRYSKDFVESSGQDRGWVDMVRFLTPTGPPLILTQPQSRAVAEGSSVTWSVVAIGAPPLSYQWLKNATALTGATNASFNIPMVKTNDAASYSVVVSNPLGSVTSAPAALTVSATLLDVPFNPGVDGEVHAMAVQADGKIVVGGDFTELGGQPHFRIGRLNPDGTMDPTFNSEAAGPIYSLAIQADGRILVAGNFFSLGGEFRRYIGRLNPDGTVDPTFNSEVDGTIYSLAIQSDGKILVGGEFGIERLNVDGTLDITFIHPELEGGVSSIALQANGRILVGGGFTILVRDSDGDLIAYFNLVRLGPGGGIDEDYYPDPNGGVASIAVQADGQALVVGDFSSFNGASQPRDRIGRIGVDGNLGAAFVPEADGEILSIALQTDGKILLGGAFSTLNGQPRSGIGRLNANGTLDTTFNGGVDGTATSLSIQGDGKILVGGTFSAVDGQQRDNIARFNNTAPATQTLSISGSTITWLRGGTSPEAGSTFFDHTSDGTNWTSIGAGSRISGGWQRTGGSLPAGRTLRARGRVAGGYQNGSSGFAVKFYGKPLLVSQPTSRTNEAGTTASFTGEARGSEPLTYQWYKDGVSVPNQGNIAGANGPIVQLSQVVKANEGGYRLVVSNSFGSVTSVVATLTVLDPFIHEQPTGANRNPGESVTFNVVASGSPSLSYQWYHDGAEVSGATGASLALQDLSRADAGLYTVVVSNTFGGMTSAAALLTINGATVDPAFNPGTSGIDDASVYSLAVQPDGMILVGGAFTSLSGQSRSRIGRLNADGTLDTTFNPGADGGIFPGVFCLAVQSDGKILVGGAFTVLGGQTRNRIGRLNVDGTLDTTFNPGAGGDPFSRVYCLIVQADGKILVGGSFTTLTGQSRNNLGRLNANGSLDTTFNPGASGAEVRCLAVQPDGKIVVGGSFTSLGGQPRFSIGRLSSNGTMDTTFSLDTDNDVYSLAVQADGKILAGGAFYEFDGQPRGFIVRCDTNGALDVALNTIADAPVFSLAMQADGKILVGGGFSILGGQPRDFIARLDASGMLDSTFGPSADGGDFSSVNFVALQSDGKILAGGNYNHLGGQTRSNLARLNNPDAATQRLEYTASTITWLREEASPEIWNTTFEHSPDGLTWADAGSASRIIGGWQLTGVTLPTTGRLRARGQVVGGGTGSWFVESILGLNPTIRLNLIRDGSTVLLSWTGGQGPYQVQQSTNLSDPDSWQDHGAPISTNSITLPIGAGNQFLRVRSP